MPWWIWIVAGALLLALEVLTPGGFVALFFGVAALAVGALAGLSIVDELWIQALLFSGIAIVALVLFRSRLLRLLHVDKSRNTNMADIQGEIALPLQDMEAGATGKAQLRGVPWNATNADSTRLVSGQRCRVESVEGLMLFLKAE